VGDTSAADTRGVAAALAAVRARIEAAEARFGRTPGSAELLAVSKAKPAEAVAAARAAGQHAFGENYVQEAAAKMDTLADPSLEWHFIGPLQSNKTRAVAERFAWVHGVDRLKIARRLSAQRAPDAPPLQVCLQVNVSAEASKSGVAPAELTDLARAVAALPRLALRGLMAIPAPAAGLEAQRAPYRQLRELLEALQGALRGEAPDLDTLSMGMSADLEAAIAEGATLVRVGTAIFGERERPDRPAARG